MSHTAPPPHRARRRCFAAAAAAALSWLATPPPQAAAALHLFAATAPATAAAAGPSELRFIVHFRQPAVETGGPSAAAGRARVTAAGARTLRALGAEVRRELPGLAAVAAVLPDASAVTALRTRDDVALVEPDAPRWMMAGPPWSDVTNGGETLPYGLQMVQADQLADSGAATRKVCIIDSGYHHAHDDLQIAGVTASTDSATGDPFVDQHGHGTHVAGTIAAVGGNGLGVRGINPSQWLQLHIVKVFGQSGIWAYSSDLVAALGECRAAGAHVVSMSLGGGPSTVAEENAFADAWAAGVLSIAAAGNGGSNEVSYPAGYDSVVSVAAVDANEDAAGFSQRNADVELAAPGVGELSTLPPPAGYAAWNGTSMATPHVAGVAALVWSHFPGWTNGQLRTAMQQSALDRGDPGRDATYGYGIVQARAALELLCGAGCPAPPPPPVPAAGCLVDTIEGDFTTGAASGVDVSVTPGDVRLQSAFVAGGQDTSGGQSPVATSPLLAQTFTAAVSGPAEVIELFITCDGCWAFTPTLQVSVLPTNGGTPVGSPLTFAYIAPRVSPGWVSALFLETPAQLQAGKQYAVQVHPLPSEFPLTGAYAWRFGDGDDDPAGARWTSTDGGSTWTAAGTGDFALRVHGATANGPYSTTAGWLVSSLHDSRVADGRPVLWDTLNLSASGSPTTSARLQVAASDAATGPFEFVGPDGTANTWFTAGAGASPGQFGRYLRYRLDLATLDPSVGPAVHEVTTCFASQPAAQSVLRGWVTDAASGAPVTGATVGAGGLATTSGGDGGFLFTGIAGGSHDLTVSAPGYATATHEAVIVHAGFTTRRDVVLLPLAACVSDTTKEDFAAGAADGIDLATSPGELLLSRDEGTLDQSQTSFGRGNTVAPSWPQAQTFTPAANGYLQRVEVEMYCDSCSGPVPTLTLELRGASPGAPSTIVLATTSRPGPTANQPAPVTFTFATPPALIGGTRYAFVLRAGAERVGWTVVQSSYNFQLDAGAVDRYPAGAHFSGSDSTAQAWGEVAEDLIFATFMSPSGGSYAPAGTFQSRLHDAGHWASWTSLSWSRATPPGSTLAFQVAASGSPLGPFEFVGPDGTTASWFTSSGGALGPPGSGRYLRYRARLATTDLAVTPALAAVTACFEQVDDTAPPAAPAPVTGSHDGGAASSDDTVAIAWQPVSDAPSGVASYSYTFDQSPFSACRQRADAPVGVHAAVSPPLGDGTWYVHVCAVDRAGNWSAPAHGGPYVIATPCVTDTSIADFEAGAGIAVAAATPGDLRLELSPPTGIVDQELATAGPADNGWRITSVAWQAQVFTPAESGYLTRLEAQLFCQACSDEDAPIEVEIRDVAGSAPGAQVLARGTMPAFSSGELAFHAVVFAAPPALQAGTPYAFVLRPERERTGFYATNLHRGGAAFGDAYLPGAHRLTIDGGEVWHAYGYDISFRTFMAPAAGTYAPAGTWTSPVRARFGSLAWDATLPGPTSLRFQAAASDSPGGPFAFVGPDGTSASAYTAPGPLVGLPPGAFARYRALFGTTAPAASPSLHGVTACSAPGGLPGAFHTVTPCRLLDTRDAGETALLRGEERELAVTGACGVPPTARAVALNVTVVAPLSAGRVVVFPAGGEAPSTSTANFRAGLTRANNAVIAVGAGDSVALLSPLGDVDVVVDVTGWFE
jgi:serine protease